MPYFQYEKVVLLYGIFSEEIADLSFIPPSDFLASRLAGRAPTIPFAPLARPDFYVSDSESIFLSTILNFALTHFKEKIFYPHFCLISVFTSSKIRRLDNSSQSPITSGFKFPTAVGPKFLVILIVVIVAAAAGGYWYWQIRQQEPAEKAETPSTLGGEIFEKTQNPLEGQVPDTNPFKDQKNPLDTIYKNPFE